MPLLSKYCVCGIIEDAQDKTTGLPRKRIVVRFPNANTTQGIDILVSTKNKPGQLKKAACVELSISMDQVYVSDRLKRILSGP